MNNVVNAWSTLHEIEIYSKYIQTRDKDYYINNDDAWA
jgi:hypothetical protein